MAYIRNRYEGIRINEVRVDVRKNFDGIDGNAAGTYYNVNGMTVGIENEEDVKVVHDNIDGNKVDWIDSKEDY